MEITYYNGAKTKIYSPNWQKLKRSKRTFENEKQVFEYAKKQGFQTKTQLSPAIIEKYNKLIDRRFFNFSIVGEKIDRRGNMIWLLYDFEKEVLAHFYINKNGAAITYMSCIEWQTWC